MSALSRAGLLAAVAIIARTSAGDDVEELIAEALASDYGRETMRSLANLASSYLESLALCRQMTADAELDDLAGCVAAAVLADEEP